MEHQRSRRTPVEAAYVVGVAAVATGGFTAGSTALVLLAVLLALPTGAAGLVGYYLTYGLLAQLPGAHSSSSTGTGSCSPVDTCRGSSTGDLASWFVHTTDLVGILALAGAALLNVVLWHVVVRPPTVGRQS